MTDAILVASGDLPQPVIGVIRGTDDLHAFGGATGATYIVSAEQVVCAGQLWSGSEATDPPVDPVDPPRRLIPKSVVQERAHALGKLAPILAVLRSPGQEINYARWFAPDWPNVYFDDPAMLDLLQYVGCTPEEVDTITGPIS